MDPGPSSGGIFSTAEGSSSAAAVLKDGSGNGSSSEVVGHSAGPKTEPSETLESKSAGNANALGRVGEASGRPAEEHPNHDRMFKAYTHRLPPSDQVLNSKDILPLILGNLKDSYAESEHWKSAFASIIRVNRSFFGAGAALLWHTMTKVGPAFKILPWHGGGSEYRGIGTYPYRGGAVDWNRFLLYASFIRHVKLQTGSDDTLEAHWVSELVYMPNTPACLFANVHTITVGPQGIATALPLLKLLASISLQSLDITTCDQFNSHEEAVDGKVQAEFPAVRYRTPRLQSFRYKGPTGPGFFRRLFLLQSITSLDLEWVNPVSVNDLLCLADLHQLRKLRLATSVHVTPRTRQGNAIVRGVGVRDLKVIGPEMLQCLVASAQCIRPTVENVHLEVTRVDDPVMALNTLEYYLGVQLESIHIQILAPWAQQARWPSPISLVGMSDFDREMKARKSFALASNLKTATFEGVPSSLWRFMSSALQDSISGWKQLTSLKFQIQPNTSPATTTAGSVSGSANTFPGLSFLASTIWFECPSLEFLEFHFDHLKLMNEDLSRAIENVKSIAPHGLHPNGHPLRDLTINTGTVADNGSGFTFNPDRKIEIVSFLEELFPRLTSDALRGTPAALWSDMGTWLQTYRRMKVKATTGH